ncbi:MAG TPA: hypothetical protein VGO61_12850 [Steroidobacteraceae bacterium]|nr:hypothetical protein [Steroidobacteraceae bacterium]
MEIIARWRARRDLESFEEAGKDTSVAFKMLALVVGRKIGRTIRLNLLELQKVGGFMARVLFALLLLCAPIAALAADDLKVSQLESDVRDLKRQVQGLSRQIDELRSELSRGGDRPKSTPLPNTPVASTDAWLDAPKWQRVRPGMSELEVIGLLGPPTSMRGDKAERVLLYAMEIGSSGFLGGSVRLRDGLVVEVQKPALQ